MRRLEHFVRALLPMNLLHAAKELKRFIDIQPTGSLIDPGLRCDVRDTETYKLASLAIRSVETEISAQRMDLAENNCESASSGP
jgi:hypothetical protein